MKPLGWLKNQLDGIENEVSTWPEWKLNIGVTMSNVKSFNQRKKDALNRIQLGENIRIYREKIGLTQKQLAKKVGVGRTSITNTELGKQNPPATVLLNYLRALNITIEELFKDIK